MHGSPVTAQVISAYSRLQKQGRPITTSLAGSDGGAREFAEPSMGPDFDFTDSGHDGVMSRSVRSRAKENTPGS
jgi:hypothetical protein